MTTDVRQISLSRLQQFLALTKPRVVSLIVFTAVIGMFLATPGMVPLQALVFGTLGIGLVAGAAAAVNCLVEQKVDAVMARTRARPLPMGQVTSLQTLLFAGVVGGIGLTMLYALVNPLTMWLTLATFVGYAVVYTVILKPLTPQNIVIGGASGAMPPVLGWTAVTGELQSDALLLFLIIFAWTPPHFWALALYRKHEYAKAGIPMLPVTHGDRYTRLHVLLYTLILLAVSMLPFATRMSGLCLPRCRACAGRVVPLVCGEDLRRLQRPSCAEDLPLLDRLPVSAVCGAAGRTTTGASSSDQPRTCRELAAAFRSCASLRAGCVQPGLPGSGLPLHRHHRRGLRQGLPAYGFQRPGTPADGFPRQGGSGVLRLHPLPGRLPDDAR